MFHSHLIIAAKRDEPRSSTPPHTPGDRSQACDRGHVFTVPKVREVRTTSPVDERELW